MKNDWNVLVKEATRFDAVKPQKGSVEERPIEVVVE
jgi:hypothetical protein